MLKDSIYCITAERTEPALTCGAEVAYCTRKKYETGSQRQARSVS
jgi:hypothetical protein